MRIVPGALAAAVVVLAGCSPGQDLDEAEPVPPEQQVEAEVPPEVEMVDISFRPEVLRIAAGMTVTWTNNDEVAHTVTFSGDTTSDLINPGETYSREFASPGEFDYICTIHEDMTGRIEVVVAEDG